MNLTFAKVTEYHETLEFQVTPCARFLYHWLLRNARAGSPQEVELEDFIAFTAKGRSRPYSLRHVWRALKELFNLGVVDVVKEYSWKIWKLIAYHPLLAETSRSLPETSRSGIKKSHLGTSNPDSVVPYYREFREHTDNPPSLPVVVGGFSDPIGVNQDGFAFAAAKSSELPQEDKQEKISTTPPEFSTSELDPISQNSLNRVKEVISPQVLHSQLQKFVLETDLAILENAIAVVQENKAKGRLKNPSGLLVKAVRGKWCPVGERQTVTDGFRAWYEQALKEGHIQRFTSDKGAVTGYQDGVMCVMRRGQDTWMPWLDLQRSLSS